MNASSAACRSSSVHGSSSAPVAAMIRARVIEARIAILQRRRQQLAVADPEERRRRALEHAAVGRDEQRLVEPALLGEPRREHVPRVRQRLEAVEHAVGAYVMVATRATGARRGSGSTSDDPAAAAREHDPQDALDGSGLLEQRRDLGPQGLAVQRQPQAGARAPKPRQVILERERTPGVQPRDLERAVAAQKALVRDRDPRLLGRPDGAVDARELHRAQGIRATTYTRCSAASRSAPCPS